jgi:2-polyprenyl-3-methyl-5-hydroxy-6-metoxy-1,4-benzoquinol methylase
MTPSPAASDEVRSFRAAAYESSRPDLRALVPPTARRILDLGCATGSVGEALARDLGAEVVGVESDPVYAEAAEPRLSKVVLGDLEALATEDGLAAKLGTFDCVIAGDVLEHLVDPETALQSFAGLLAPNGTAIVSLPNVRYWQTFWQLGRRGSWPRRRAGLFDRDHLRWFTTADGLELVRAAGLEPRRIEREYRLTPLGSRLDRHLPGTIGRTPLRPFFVFQFAIVAVPSTPQA